MTPENWLVKVALFAIISTTASQTPKLEMETYFVNVTNVMSHGDHFGYVTTLKHADDSHTFAKGVHVTWMLASFIKYNNLVSYSQGISPPRVVLKDDSVTLQIAEIVWGLDVTISFKVLFDPEKSLKPKYYDIVTPVHLLYYDEYSENSDGVVVSKGTPYPHPLGKVSFDVELPGCSEPLGMKSGKIKDYQITASSSYADAQPSKARETEDAWCTRKPDSEEEKLNQYIQVDFLLKTRVIQVGTMRRKSKDHWVSEYYLKYSDDDVNWIEYQENGHTRMFLGPQSKEDTEMIVHRLRHPIEAYSIRFHPWESEQLVCMRLELYGCDILGSPASCVSPLGLESGEIPDEALSHSLPASHDSKAQYIRLNLPVTSFPFGWFSRPYEIPPDYLQIDFGSLRKVTRLSTMGGYGSDRSDRYVATYKLSHSKDGLTWVEYRENGQIKDLRGPKSRQESVYPVLAKLAEPFVSRYLRIIPNDKDSNFKVMRAEIYGCFAEDLPPYNGVPEYTRRSFLLDPVTDWFYVCMYTAEKTESSCFSTADGVEWIAIEPSIISVVSCNPTLREIYGVDRQMNFHRSCDSGESWRQLTDGYLKDVQKETQLINSTALPENLVAGLPTADLRVTANSTGTTWGVSGSGIHVMTAGSNAWSLVGSWKCCGQ